MPVHPPSPVAGGRPGRAARRPQLAALRAARGHSVTIARRELRAWLRGSAAGARVEAGVGRLLGGG